MSAVQLAIEALAVLAGTLFFFRWERNPRWRQLWGWFAIAAAALLIGDLGRWLLSG